MGINDSKVRFTPLYLSQYESIQFWYQTDRSPEILPLFIFGSYPLRDPHKRECEQQYRGCVLGGWCIKPIMDQL